jgi:hypothetical protein
MNDKSRITLVFDITPEDIGHRIYVMGDEKAQIQGTLYGINPHPSWPDTFIIEIEGTVAGNPWSTLLEVPATLNVIIYEV